MMWPQCSSHSCSPGLQGRAACEIDTADELLATELLLNGVFSELDEHLLAALASTLIPQDKTQVCWNLTTEITQIITSRQRCSCLTASGTLTELQLTLIVLGPSCTVLLSRPARCSRVTGCPCAQSQQTSYV